jgi:hypothetical protein
MSGVRRRLWWGLLAIAVLIVFFGIGDVQGGVTVDPGIALAVVGLSPAEIESESAAAYRMWDFATRSAGATLAVVGVLMAVILAVPYRAGERWAWWLMWILPLWAVVVPVMFLTFGTASGQPPAPPMISGPILAVVAAGILLADRSRFYGQASSSAPQPTGAESWTGG